MDDNGQHVNAINYTQEGKVFIFCFKCWSSVQFYINSCNNSNHFTQWFDFLFLERVDVAPEVAGDIDQVAVVTSNVLFFVILFIFAVFET